LQHHDHGPSLDGDGDGRVVGGEVFFLGSFGDTLDFPERLARGRIEAHHEALLLFERVGVEDENPVGEDGRGTEAVIGGEFGPLAFPELLAGVIERDRFSALSRAPGDVDALGIDRRGRGGEGVELMKVVRFDRRIPGPGLFPRGGVIALDAALRPVGRGDGEKKLFPPKHRRRMAESVELHRPGVVGLGELRFQSRHAADAGAVGPRNRVHSWAWPAKEESRVSKTSRDRRRMERDFD
jgi:hypothetical protein